MSDELWGMSIDLAVGLIGFIGVLVGAFVAGAVTIWVAWWQAREQLRNDRKMRLYDDVLDLAEQVSAIGRAVESGSQISVPTQAVIASSRIVMLRGGSVAPELIKCVLDASSDLGAALATAQTFRAGPARDEARITEARKEIGRIAREFDNDLRRWLFDPERMGKLMRYEQSRRFRSQRV